MDERISTVSARLRERMDELKIKQIDIVEKSKKYKDIYGMSISKTVLSEYVRGNAEPGNIRLKILSEILNVSEMWLMGYNTQKHKKLSSSQADKDFDLLDKWHKLTDSQQQLIEKMIDEFLNQ